MNHKVLLVENTHTCVSHIVSITSDICRKIERIQKKNRYRFQTLPACDLINLT